MNINNKILLSCLFFPSVILAVANISPYSAAAQSQNDGLLSTLKNGLWQFREPARGNNIVDAICVGDITKMVKIKNKDDICTLKMLRKQGNSVTYDYVCSGKGKGRTTIRKETSGLVQIASQGIANGELFDFKLEARHAGQCR